MDTEQYDVIKVLHIVDNSQFGEVKLDDAGGITVFVE